jgi:hypothetical protein
MIVCIYPVLSHEKNGKTINLEQWEGHFWCICCDKQLKKDQNMGVLIYVDVGKVTAHSPFQDHMHSCHGKVGNHPCEVPHDTHFCVSQWGPH